MGFEVIVGLRGKLVVEGVATYEACLHSCSLLQGIVVLGQRVGLASLSGGQSGVFALFDDLLQLAQRIERAGEARVGIEVRERLLGLADGQTMIESFVEGLLESLHITFRLVGCDGHESLLFVSEHHMGLCINVERCCQQCGRQHQCSLDSHFRLSLKKRSS